MDTKQPPTFSPTTSSGPSRSKPKRAGELFAGTAESTLATLTQPKAQRSTALPELERQQQQLISGVFARMKSIYGHLWSSNWKTEDQLRIAQFDWYAAIRRHGFTLGEINATLDHLADNEPDMPNLPRFLETARSIRDLERRRRANREQPLALPETEEQAAARKAMLARERERFKAIGLEQVQALKKQLNNRSD